MESHHKTLPWQESCQFSRDAEANTTLIVAAGPNVGYFGILDSPGPSQTNRSGPIQWDKDFKNGCYESSPVKRACC
jgi:hypothetical protein